MGKNIIGQRIKILRATQTPHLSQADLLAHIHLQGWQLSQSTLSKIENGKRLVSDSELIILSKALNVSLMWLLTGK